MSKFDKFGRRIPETPYGDVQEKFKEQDERNNSLRKNMLPNPFDSKNRTKKQVDKDTYKMPYQGDPEKPKIEVDQHQRMMDAYDQGVIDKKKKQIDDDTAYESEKKLEKSKNIENLKKQFDLQQQQDKSKYNGKYRSIEKDILPDGAEDENFSLKKLLKSWLD